MKLNKYLKIHKIKLTEFAKLSKLKISYLSQIKNGRKTPSLRVAMIIKKKTNGSVTIEDLIL